MQQGGTETMSLDRAPAETQPWPAWAHLLLLLLLAITLHAWIISHTAVVARDAIGYVRYTILLEQQPWTQAFSRLEQHPLYPLLVLAMSLPVRHWFGAASPEAMSLSCQLVSALAGILLVIPLYFLGNALFDRRVGFWAAALFQCLPVCAQVTSDGLADGVFLLLLTTTLLLAVEALRRRSPLGLGWCGLAAGLAYLARPEAALAVVAVLLVLAAIQARAALRWPWLRALSGAASLALGTLLVAGPYMVMIGGVTVKPGPRKLLLNFHPTETLMQPGDMSERSREQPMSPMASGPVLASTLATWWLDERRPGEPPLWWGLKVLVQEISHGFQYLACWPALFGLWWFRDRMRRDPASWVIPVLCLIMSALLVRLALGVHYLAERHTLILVMCGSIWAAATLIRVVDALPAVIARRRHRPLGPRTASFLTVSCLVLAVGWCVPEVLKPLHANRVGHRAAGQWLAEHTGPADRIVDPFSWASFYSGRLCDEARTQTKLSPGAHHFVVLTFSKNLHLRLSGLDQAKAQVKPTSAAVFHWTPTPQQHKRYHAEEVVIYDVEPPPAHH